jgi:hypothetical protein
MCHFSVCRLACLDLAWPLFRLCIVFSAFYAIRHIFGHNLGMVFLSVYGISRGYAGTGI